MWEAVRALPRRQREAVALRYLLGFSEAEVARQMQVAVGTASATLAAARARLAVLLALRQSDRGGPTMNELSDLLQPLVDQASPGPSIEELTRRVKARRRRRKWDSPGR